MPATSSSPAEWQRSTRSAPCSTRAVADSSSTRTKIRRDYPRSGYIFNALARHHIGFRDYGDLVQVSGYDEGSTIDLRTDDPQYAGIDDRDAATTGLGGRYSLDVPAPAVLDGHIDPKYPGWNLRIRDERRAKEFIRDYGALVARRHNPATRRSGCPTTAAASAREFRRCPKRSPTAIVRSA